MKSGCAHPEAMQSVTVRFMAPPQDMPAARSGYWSGYAQVSPGLLPVRTIRLNRHALIAAIHSAQSMVSRLAAASVWVPSPIKPVTRKCL